MYSAVHTFPWMIVLHVQQQVAEGAAAHGLLICFNGTLMYVGVNQVCFGVKERGCALCAGARS
jgi:hypothetical protein